MTSFAFVDCCSTSSSSDWSNIDQLSKVTQSSDSSINRVKIATIASWEKYRGYSGKRVKEDVPAFLLKILDGFSDQTVISEFLAKSTALTKFEWLNEIYEDGLSKSLAHELYPLVEKIDSYIDHSNFEDLDELLTIIELDRLSPSLLSVLLRSTAPEKDDLPFWESLRNEIINEIEVRKESAGTWLRGLI